MSGKTKRSRPYYEGYGVSRVQIEKDLPQWIECGWVGEPEEEAAMVEQACREMHFADNPKSGWAYIAREIRIIHFQLPERRTISRKEMGKRCSAYADQIWETAKNLGELASHEDFVMAAIESKGGVGGDNIFEYANLQNKLFDTVRPLRRFAAYLESSKQSRKVQPLSARERRLVLACKLRPVYEAEFDCKARLKGGSAAYPIEEESPWAQFYQAIASLLLDEKATLDRQSVLREATWPAE